MYNSVVFSTCPGLTSYHHRFQNVFITPKRNLTALSHHPQPPSHSALPCPAQTRQPFMFFLFLRIWPILGISYKRDPTLCGLLCQLCFTQPYVFRAHLCCSESGPHSFSWPSNILSCGCALCWTLGLFPLSVFSLSLSGLPWWLSLQSLSWEDPLEEEMAPHSSILAWEIPWTEEPGGLQCMGSQSRTRLSDPHFFLFSILLYGCTFCWTLGLFPLSIFKIIM